MTKIDAILIQRHGLLTMATRVILLTDDGQEIELQSLRAVDVRDEAMQPRKIILELEESPLLRLRQTEREP